MDTRAMIRIYGDIRSTLGNHVDVLEREEVRRMLSPDAHSEDELVASMRAVRAQYLSLRSQAPPSVQSHSILRQDVTFCPGVAYNAKTLLFAIMAPSLLLQYEIPWRVLCIPPSQFMVYCIAKARSGEVRSLLELLPTAIEAVFQGLRGCVVDSSDHVAHESDGVVLFAPVFVDIIETFFYHNSTSAAACAFFTGLAVRLPPMDQGKCRLLMNLLRVVMRKDTSDAHCQRATIYISRHLLRAGESEWFSPRCHDDPAPDSAGILNYLYPDYSSFTQVMCQKNSIAKMCGAFADDGYEAYCNTARVLLADTTEGLPDTGMMDDVIGVSFIVALFAHIEHMSGSPGRAYLFDGCLFPACSVQQLRRQVRSERVRSNMRDPVIIHIHWGTWIVYRPSSDDYVTCDCAYDAVCVWLQTALDAPAKVSRIRQIQEITDLMASGAAHGMRYSEIMAARPTA